LRFRHLVSRARSAGVCGASVTAAALLFVACTQPNAAYHWRRADAPVFDAALTETGATDAPGGSQGDGPGLLDAAAMDAPALDASPLDAPALDVPASDVAAMDAGGQVVGPGKNGLILHWRFDEATGNVVEDSSGGGFNGTYEGSTPPATDPGRAPTTFNNPASRRFTASLSHGVRLTNPPSARLKPAEALTVSVWFRTTQATRADLVGFGLDYFIRNNLSGEFQFVRRRAAGTSNQYWAATARSPGYIDDRWHHIVGVTTVNRIALWIDGVVVGQQSQTYPFVYTDGSTALAGQSGVGPGLHFDGWLDDVRIYERALSDDEIKALASGQD
jgi:hypothetical protein